MAVTGMQFNWMWARDFDGSHSHSVTVQVPNVAAVCEIALMSTWTAGESHSESSAFITQCVSASGVENFPAINYTDTSLRGTLFRDKVTSVTFKVAVYNTKGAARWVIHHWA